MVFCFCPDAPPEKVSAKGSRGAQQKLLLDYQGNPHMFALGLKDACCTEPACCCLSAFGAFPGCTACWARKAVLEKYYNGMDDYVCCQGYLPRCCCVDMSNCCKGSPAGLFCEACCCPVFSLSIARIHLMHSKRIRPDPCDYQIIACSNCLQLIACILDIIAIFVEQVARGLPPFTPTLSPPPLHPKTPSPYPNPNPRPQTPSLFLSPSQLREAAHIVDLLADLVTCSVAGCMGAQIYHEIKKDKDEITFVVVEGVPVGSAYQPPPATQDGAGAPPKAEEMER
mmetsp:Transcript_30982/g.90929  ORF Transcript_30982/g.90929 Transcript_30982/m.90929 type:complete len:283 (+) Transcript_30982:22-870(+)